MVGNTTTVQTLQERADEFEVGRLLLHGVTCTVDETGHDHVESLEKPNALPSGLDAENSGEAQNGATAGEKVIEATPVVNFDAFVEECSGAHPRKVAPDEPGKIPDVFIELSAPSKPELFSQKTNAVLTEHIRFRNRADDSEVLDSSVIPIKSFDLRRVELVVQNREKQTHSTISLSDSPFTTPCLSYRSTEWNFVFNTWLLKDRADVREIYDVVRGSSLRGLGKFTGSGLGGIIWGETLADFFHATAKQPWSFSGNYSSSFLFNWVRAQNTDIPFSIRRLMSSAEREDRPRPVPVYDIEKLILESEAWIRENEAVYWTGPQMADMEIKAKEGEPWELPKSWPPKDAFSPSAYPRPWPLEPFKKQFWEPSEEFGSYIRLPKLQQYIPQHLLPETLFVHDPYEVLHATAYWSGKMPWTERDDIVRVYKLQHEEKKSTREAQDLESYEEDIVRVQSVIDAFLAEPHSRTERPQGMLYQPEPHIPITLGPCKPPIYIVFPPKPPQPPAKVAHLYVSPAARLGTGHHSYVFRVELEVPRSLLVSEEICRECVMQDVKQILEEQDGAAGERRDARWEDLSGRYTIKLQGTPPRRVMLGDEEYQATPDDRKVEVVYEGPYRAIQTKVGYQNLERAPYCEHLRKERIHPLTTKVQVAAKISMEGDDHLDYEAKNYRAFPKEFFEHYNGFNLVEPLTQPTTVGAIVPQFYGHYVLDRDDDRNQEWKGRYLSPILLLEDCGVSIDPDTICIDDERECVALFYKLHKAGYYHGSAYRRNIVRQPGLLKNHPVMRHSREKGSESTKLGIGCERSQWSYRLIDFGRTRHETDPEDDDYWECLSYEKDKMSRWRRNHTLS